jgi:hypothetical protein
LPEEGRRDITAQVVRAIHYRDDAGIEHGRPELGLAISFRIRALARLTADGGLQGFRQPGSEEGMDWLHTDVLRAATDVPLRQTEDDAAFDAAEVHEYLSKIATTAGSASSGATAVPIDASTLYQADHGAAVTNGPVGSFMTSRRAIIQRQTHAL